MAWRVPWRALPGALAILCMTAIASFWTAWSIGEFYYEGWGAAPPGPFLYLIPAGLTIGLTVLAIRLPLVGAVFLIAVGGWFGFWWLRESISAGASLSNVLVRFLLSGAGVLIGLLFLAEWSRRRRAAKAGAPIPTGWWRRRAWYVVALGPPAVIVLGFTIYWAPILATRQDDGDRGARLVEGHGVTLVWAPEGPGWNWRQSFGGFPSWTSLALYGAPPLGLEPPSQPDDRVARRNDMTRTCLCRYLSADGLRLENEPVGVWRMPTADELVRSLTRGGENAGCSLADAFPEERFTRAVCATTPDKETPLWAPDLEPIYYWVADELDEERAFYVNYQGAINAQPKRWGNPRHGYRCVRDP
jgi:hypothetical protein